METFVEALQYQQWWTLAGGTFLLVVYRLAEDQWIGRLAIAIGLIVIAMGTFISADAVEFIADIKGQSDQVKVAVSSARFASSVVWGAIGVGLAIHSVSYERRG